MLRDPATVAVLMFDRTPMFETSVPISVFGVDRTTSGAPAFTLLAVAGEPGPFTTTGGIQVAAPHGLDALRGAGIVVVPGWRDAQEMPPEPALRALRAATPTARSSSVCAWARSCSRPRVCSTGAAPRPTGCTRRHSRRVYPR